MIIHSFRILLTLRGSSPISQEVSKLAQRTVLMGCATLVLVLVVQFCFVENLGSKLVLYSVSGCNVLKDKIFRLKKSSSSTSVRALKVELVQ